MIQINQVKGCISGFIINHLHIHLILIFHNIYSVNPSSPEGYLKAFRLKFSLFQLFLKCPYRPSEDSPCSLDHIFISGTAFEHRVSIICHNIIQTPVRNFIPFLFCQLCPFHASFSHFFCKAFQCFMHNISHIHRFKLIFHTLGKLHSILKEMCKCTGCKTFQSGSTVR